MNVRFSEPCRDAPLDLNGAEETIRVAIARDGRTQKELALTCTKDIFIGVFFDGTNNNKYRDTPGFAHSNVARLYEVYPGTNAAQTAPALLPKIKPDGTKAPRPIFADQPFKAASVPTDEYPYYRKIYVSGLGTRRTARTYWPVNRISSATLHKPRKSTTLLPTCATMSSTASTSTMWMACHAATCSSFARAPTSTARSDIR